MVKKIAIINGPNLNMLGMRQPEIYGKDTLSDIENLCKKEISNNSDLEIEFFQSNHEGEIIDVIQKIAINYKDYVGIIINAAAYTHTSIAIMDSLLLVKDNLPIIEVHLSDIYKREEFRHISYISRVANKIICGKGKDGYIEAIRYLNDL